MTPAALRQDHRWWADALNKRLRPSVVGGLPVPAATPMSVYPCPEPSCDLTDRDPETVFIHAMETHYNRRKSAREARGYGDGSAA